MPVRSLGKQSRGQTKKEVSADMQILIDKSVLDHERFIQEMAELDLVYLQDLMDSAPTIEDGVLYFPVPNRETRLKKLIDRKVQEQLSVLRGNNGDQDQESQENQNSTSPE